MSDHTHGIDKFAVSYYVFDAMKARAEKAEAFKAWTHQYLDTHDVPHHPPGIHGAAGCRIGDRMDWLMSKLAAAKTEVAELKDHLVELDAQLAHAQRSYAEEVYKEDGLEKEVERLRGLALKYEEAETSLAFETNETTPKAQLDRDHTQRVREIEGPSTGATTDGN